MQFDLPVKVFILNNQYMGMVRQWQQLLHGNRMSHSYTDGAARLRQAGRGLRRHRHALRQIRPTSTTPSRQMIDTKGPVIFDCRVAALANCFPMIPSGKAHNEMLLGDDVSDEEVARAIGEEGKVLV